MPKIAYQGGLGTPYDRRGRRRPLPGRARAVWRVGGPARAPAGAIRLLGVHASEPWSVVGRNFAIIATAVTAVVVWLQVARGQEGLPAALPMSLLLALPFAAANAATEEGLVRLALLREPSMSSVPRAPPCCRGSCSAPFTTSVCRVRPPVSYSRASSATCSLDP